MKHEKLLTSADVPKEKVGGTTIVSTVLRPCLSWTFQEEMKLARRTKPQRVSLASFLQVTIDLSIYVDDSVEIVARTAASVMGLSL